MHRYRANVVHLSGLHALLVAALAACRPAADILPRDARAPDLDASVFDASAEDSRVADALPTDVIDGLPFDAADADTPAHVPVSSIGLIQPSAAIAARSPDPPSALAYAEFSRSGDVVEAPGARASGPCVVWPFPLGYQRRITEAVLIDPHGSGDFLSADMLDLYYGWLSPLPFWNPGDRISVSLLGYGPTELTVGPVVFPDVPSGVSPVADADNVLHVRPSDGITVAWTPRSDGKVVVRWSASPMLNMNIEGRCVFDATVGHGVVPPDALREVTGTTNCRLVIGGFDRTVLPSSGPTGPVELTVENDIVDAAVVFVP